MTWPHLGDILWLTVVITVTRWWAYREGFKAGRKLNHPTHLTQEPTKEQQ